MMAFFYVRYFVSALLLAARAVQIWRRPPYPPGPKGRYPLLGMTFDMPKERPWETFTEWAREYGPLIHFRIGLQHVIVINDPIVYRELLDQRSSVYSSRPPSEVGDIISLGLRSVLMPYDNRWKHVRRIFTNIMTPKRCDTYVRFQELEALAAIHNIAAQPNTYAHELHRYALSVARTVAFGRRVLSIADPFARDLQKVTDNFSSAMLPGKYLFESISILRKLPRSLQPWLPELEAFRELESSFSLQNYQSALRDGEKHPSRPSMAREIHAEMQKDGGKVDKMQAATNCMEILVAGSETTANSLLFIMLALVNHPEVVQKAHEELDRFVGQDRYPTWEDEPNLPYIRAIIKETHRWRGISPLSFQHYTDRSDVYRGYYIPKGAVVRINHWAMHHSSHRYTSPQTFDPTRYLSHTLSAAAYANSSNVAASDHFAYGGGKRICPGLHLAERSLFTVTSRVLQTFELRVPGTAVDGQGSGTGAGTGKERNGVRPEDVGVTTTLVMAPGKPFPVDFQGSQ